MLSALREGDIKAVNDGMTQCRQLNRQLLEQRSPPWKVSRNAFTARVT